MPSTRQLGRRPLSPEAAFRLTAERAARCVFLFDFDGTLAPIIDDPAAVRLVPGALDALGELARRVRRVAIVSARPAEFLRRHFATLPEITVYGMYGLESQRGTEPVQTRPDALPYVPVMRDLAERAGAELPGGVLVEYKRLGVALHYRMAPWLREVVEGWARRSAAESALRLQTGRMVVELKPPVDRDKGSVVAEQIAGLACAWYFGDDVSDLAAFAALDAREAADPAFVGIRVSVANPESGASLAPSADLSLDAPATVPGLLAGFLGTLPNADAR